MPKTLRSDPQITDLRCFLLAAQHQSLTAAAAAEGVAQSALSRQLVRLESCLGGRLLHRTGRGVALTEMGSRVLPQVKALVAQLEALRDDATGRWNKPAGVVDVGLLPSVTRPLTAMLFSHMRRDFPLIDLRMHEAYSGEIVSMLAEGTIDVGMLNHYRPLRRKTPDPVRTSELCLIVQPRSAPANAKTVRFAALQAHALVMPLRPNSLRSMVEQISSRRGLTLKVALEVDTSTAMKDAVLHCGLAATLPAQAVREEIERGELLALPITHPAIRQTTFVETTTRRPASAAVREVERALRMLVTQIVAR